MVYCNPHIAGWYNPLYTLNSQVFFFAEIVLWAPLSFQGSSCTLDHVERGQQFLTIMVRTKLHDIFWSYDIPIGSMYGIFTNY